MKPFLITVIIGGVLMTISGVLFFIGIMKKRLPVFIWSLIFFIAACIVGAYSGFVLFKRVAGHVAKQRSGMEIYTALFGKPSEHCVDVMHATDQVVPVIDCCIWLEFKTCPQELNRIAMQREYKIGMVAAADTFGYSTVSGAEPEWWKPYKLGDSIVVLKDVKPEDPKHAYYLLISTDNTHAFYCDMLN